MKKIYPENKQSRFVELVPWRLITRITLVIFFIAYSGLSMAQMKVIGKGLYDVNGERFIARGFEQSFGISLSENGEFIDQMAKINTNAVRFVFDLHPGQLNLTQVDNLILKAKNAGMVSYISLTGFDNFDQHMEWFERNDVYNMLQKHKDYIIIDAIQEHTAPTAEEWAAECKKNIARLRNRGYVVPLACMSNDYGRNHNTIISKAAEIFNSDPLKNTFFNVQAYWDQNWSGPKKYSTELLNERIPQLAALNYCVQIGVANWAEGAPCDNGFVDYKTAMSLCQEYDLGWLVWDWHNPYEWSHVFSVTTNGVYGNWNNICTNPAVSDCRDDAKYGCDYGYQVTIGHAASIQNTSVKTCYFQGNVNCGGSDDTQAPSSPTGLTSTGKTSSSVSLTWTNSTDNVGVTGYEVFIGSSTTPTKTSSNNSTTVSGLSASIAYSFTVKAVDAAGNRSAASAALSVTTSAASGGVIRELWTGISGTGVSAIPVSTSPNSTSTVTSLEGPTNSGDNYGARIRAFITPATTGSYTFYIAGDDNCELWLSTNSNSDNKIKLAEVTGWTNSREWTKFASQKSSAISLTAGTKYYVEVLHKEATGGDHVAVGWTGPGISSITVIGGSALSPYTEGDTQAPTAPTGLTSTSKTSSSVSLSWTASTDNVGVTGYEIYTGSSSTPAGTSTNTTTTISGLSASTTYSFTVKAKDASGNLSAASTTLSVTTNAASTTTVTREYWSGVGGTAVSAIPVSTLPTGTDQLSSLEGPTNWGDNYGTRIRALLKPSTTGSYTFYIAGDDNCQLWLSTDANPANKVKIAEVTGWTNSREWTKEPSQKSTARTLTANTNYYIEILHKEGNGGDNVAAGWTGPGISAITVIGGSNISAYTSTPPITATKLEAESAVLTGGAGINNNHAGYSGTGFVDGYWNQGASTSFSYNATSAGSYNVRLRYANGTASPNTVSVYVNNVKIRQISLANFGVWSTWGDKTEPLSLNAGANTIAIRFDPGDVGYINLDFIEVTSSGASASTLGRMASNTEIEFIPETGETEVSVYPNPANNVIHIGLHADKDKQVNIQLINYVGAVQIDEQHKLREGNNNLLIDTSSLISGLYFLKVGNTPKRSMKKVFIVR